MCAGLNFVQIVKGVFQNLAGKGENTGLPASAPSPTIFSTL